jgi:hypothetical protein
MNCDPAQLLRHISPAEAELAYQDAALGIHIRFRLGGASFPPALYFKVFTHQPLFDVNAFAPRDYAGDKSTPTELQPKSGVATLDKAGCLRVGRWA